MGRYNPNSMSRMPKNRKTGVHPIWRGIGFVLMIIIPFMAYAGTMLLLEQNRMNGWVQIPSDLLAVGSDPLLYVKIILTVFLIFLLYSIFLLFTFVINSLFGPPRYGPTDAPPTSYRGRRYKR